MSVKTKVKSVFERLVAKGEAVECACCHARSRRFFPAGVERVRVHARCARCQSLERHRLICLMLKRGELQKGGSALCIAPEQPITRALRDEWEMDIITADLSGVNVDVQADICELPFEDEHFSIVVANHVLEHVPNDAQALRELYRVTKPGGIAILQTPVDWSTEKTDEDPGAPEEERLRRFGQRDHVRLYGADLVERIRGAGWQIEVIPVTGAFSEQEIARFGFEEDERFLKIQK